MESIRNKNIGEVYTPDCIADLLFYTVQEVRPDFNKTNIVWDCCWGTGNLTKNKEFNNLYCSTLRASDIRKNRKNNPKANKFAYDFLNTDIDMLQSDHSMYSYESSLPAELVQAFKENKPVTFYINPPYVTTYTNSNSLGNVEMEYDTRGSDTHSRVKEVMANSGMGRCSDQMYAQFLYRIIMMKKAYKNNNISIALLSPMSFLAGPMYKVFREVFLKEFHLENAYLFRANIFKGLSESYGLSASYWESGESEDKCNFKYKIVYNPDDSIDQYNIEDYTVYNIDDRQNLGQYIKEVSPLETELAEYTATSGVKIIKENPNKVRVHKDSLGYFFFHSNNLYQYKKCGLIGQPYKGGQGISINKDNIDICMTSAAARICLGRYTRDIGNKRWALDSLEFQPPDTNTSEYRQLMLNCYMYCMFTGQTHFASVIIDGKEFPNNFFHLSYDYMSNLYKKYGVEIKTPSKRPDTIVVQRINELFQNQDLVYPYGKELWQAGLQMWEDTMDRRLNGFADSTYQVENWDAGFYQIKQLTKDDNKMIYLKDFNKIFREYEVSIQKAIKQVGFIR